MKKSKIIIKIALLTMVFAALVGGAFFFWHTFFARSNNFQPITHPFSSLLTYTNTKHGLTLQYPAQFFTKVLTTSMTKTVYGYKDEEDLFVASTTDGYQIAVVFEKNPTYRYTMGTLASVIDVGGRRAYQNNFAETNSVGVPGSFCQHSYTTIPIGDNEILIDASRCGVTKDFDSDDIANTVHFFTKTDDDATQQLISSIKFDSKPAPSNALTYPLSEEQAANRAIDSYVGADLNTLPASCIMAAPSNVSKSVILYYIMEIYNKTCGGDPNTSPIMRALKVYRLNSLVEIQSTVTGRFSSIWQPYYESPGYTLRYPSDFILDKNFVYSDNVTSVPLSGVKMSLAEDAYPKGLFKGSYVAIVTNPKASNRCDVKDFLDVKFGESFGNIKDVKNGLTDFNRGVGVGVGGGSKYYDVLYTTPNHNPCYGLLLRINLGDVGPKDMKTTTGQYFGEINYLFDQIVKTFKLK